MTWPYVWEVEPVWTVEPEEGSFSYSREGGTANDTSSEDKLYSPIYLLAYLLTPC